jgi:hypothetical protein
VSEPSANDEEEFDDEEVKKEIMKKRSLQVTTNTVSDEGVEYEEERNSRGEMQR